MATMTSRSIASGVLKTIGERALKVAEHSRDPDLGLLATRIWTLATLEISAVSSLRNENLEKLLRAVENFLSIPEARADENRTGYAYLQDIADGELPIIELDERIKTCWGRGRNLHRQTLLDLIKENSEFDENETLGVDNESAITENPLEYSLHVNNNVYKVLHDHVVCTCHNNHAEQPATSHHSPKLRLQPRFCEPADHNNNVQFDMIFSSHPITSNASEIDWCGTQILISSKDRSKKIARIERIVSDPQIIRQSQTNSDDETDIVAKGGVCIKLAARESNTCLRFKVSREQLKCYRKRQPMEQQLLKDPGYHLGEILQNHSMKPRLRLILAYIIAKSVWQYYNSNWMNTVWTHHNIHFMQEVIPGQAAAVFCKPYLSVEFEDTEVGALEYRKQKSSGYQSVDGVFHRYPIVLGLGMMLLEIGTGKCLRAQKPMKWDSLTINSILADGIKTYSMVTEKDDWASGCDFPVYKSAVRKCFEADLFHEAPFRTKEPDADLEKRRSILYTEVVHPLETLINNTGWFQDSERYVERTPFQGGSSNLIPSKSDRRSSKMSPSPPTCRDGFEIAIICALPLEYDSVSDIFDEFWDDDGDRYGRAMGDPNTYTTGRMGKYNVVLALLPGMGKIKAASAAASMRSSFRCLQLALLVGVCGGIPGGQNSEIRLGDVIVSETLVQYDFGRQYPGRFVRKSTAKDNLGRPNKYISNLLTSLRTSRCHSRLEQRTALYLQQLQSKVRGTERHGAYDYPGVEEDKLFEPSYRHKHYVSHSCSCQDSSSNLDTVCEEALDSLCETLGCDDGHLVPRKRRQVKQASQHSGSHTAIKHVVHLGAVASGDRVMKSAADRDRIAKEENVIAFEMEGAGIWDEIPCIVVKGVCDYADCHKNKTWQDFAAAIAAAASKAIIEFYTQTDKPVETSARVT